MLVWQSDSGRAAPAVRRRWWWRNTSGTPLQGPAYHSEPQRHTINHLSISAPVWYLVVTKYPKLKYLLTSFWCFQPHLQSKLKKAMRCSWKHKKANKWWLFYYTYCSQRSKWYWFDIDMITVLWQTEVKMNLKWDNQSLSTILQRSAAWTHRGLTEITTSAAGSGTWPLLTCVEAVEGWRYSLGLTATVVAILSCCSGGNTHKHNSHIQASLLSQVRLFKDVTGRSYRTQTHLSLGSRSNHLH